MSKSVITMGQGLARVTPRVEVSSQLVRRTDAAEDRACGDDQGAREVHLAGAASTGEVPVLGAHGDLGGRVARSGARLDAGATRRIDELVESHAVAWVTRRGHHRAYREEVDHEGRTVGGTRVGPDDAPPNVVGVET